MVLVFEVEVDEGRADSERVEEGSTSFASRTVYLKVYIYISMSDDVEEEVTYTNVSMMANV